MENHVPQNPSNVPCKDNEPENSSISLLPKTKGWLGSSSLSLYQNFWCPSTIVPNVVSFQKHFKPLDDDIIIASKPKSGTTWLKALVFAIVNRANSTRFDTPLLGANPHELVPFFEFTLYAKNELPNLTHLSSPRLFSTHVPFHSLPECVTKGSEARIVYVCRSPLDAVVSHWHFAGEAAHDGANWALEDFVDTYCEGREVFGPFWSHFLGYWNESLENPRKVLFLKYEDLKKDAKSHVERLAEFLGFPFSEEEESEGKIEEIVELCSLGNLKGLDVNKNGKFMPYFENKSYFRKGEVGDWVNHLSPVMIKRVEKLVDEKLSPFGLTF